MQSDILKTQQLPSACSDTLCNLRPKPLWFSRALTLGVFMSLDVSKVNRDISASFGNNGFSFQIGNPARNEARQLERSGFWSPVGDLGTQQIVRPRCEEQSSLQQIMSFTLELVKTVLQFVKGGGLEQKSTEGGAGAAGQVTTPTTVPSSGSPGKTENTGSPKEPVAKEAAAALNEAATSIEGKVTELMTALAALAGGAKNLSKTARKGLKGMFSKGIKLGKSFAKYGKALGF
jgi:hypothetical protein